MKTVPMLTIEIRPCLLGFDVTFVEWGAHGIYERFHDILWGLLNYPGEFTVVVR